MHCCTDVAYDKETAVAAALFFEQWGDDSASEQWWTRGSPSTGYLPGEFYKRELPILMELLSPHRDRLKTIVVDGYVWLGQDRPGLGHFLYRSLDRKIPVIGVAKNSFHGNDGAIRVLRGKSVKPLWVTCAGMDLEQAARLVEGMHGEFRLPTLVKAADRLGRDKLNREPQSHFNPDPALKRCSTAIQNHTSTLIRIRHT